ncbi:U2 small nuclear ribonucleoprotein 40K [Novymonas esmeraldas]|uniref:U2 small nuclear ribonucleoprotein 40K n=1 Tax=Novymonas esmeraldas TaxID=1808958 RepID=A0AAW0F190_9TRYP
MRLTMDLVRRAPQFTNTMLQREIDLRGLRISSLDEHVLVLLDDSFDVVNLTANALAALEYFPTRSAGKDGRMCRVTTLIAHRNEVQRVSVASCVLALPNVVHFLADRNRLGQTRDLCFLKQWKKLEVVSLEDNPVWESNSNGFDREKLRAFLVFLCPRLKLINYQRVTQADRERALESKEEFKRLVQSWESPLGLASPSSSLAEGKKLRKRGREGRAIAAASASAAVATDEEPGNGASSATPAATPAAAAAADAVTEEEDDDAALQTRLDQLEARLLSDDVTAEEMAQLEEEMTEISTRMLASRKRHRR